MNNNEKSIPATSYDASQVVQAVPYGPGQVVPAVPYGSGQVVPAVPYGSSQVVPAVSYGVPPADTFGIGLPPHMWPHNFIYFSVICAVVMGFLDFFTLLFFIPSIILGIIVSSKV